MKNPSIINSADFSHDRIYRYSLWRRWGGDCHDYAMFIGLNPSTADEIEDDPTIRRCMQFAMDWGYSGLCMTNLFAYRATDPKVMKIAVDPVGVENDQWLSECAVNAGIVIAAWGTEGRHMNRDSAVKMLIPDLHYLKITKNGHPGHPLYLPKTLRPIKYYHHHITTA